MSYARYDAPPAFATTAELETYMGRTLDATQTARASMLLDAATALIRAETGQVISEVPDTEIEIWGIDDQDLPLPQRPIVTVSGVLFGTDQTALVEGTDYIIWKGNLNRNTGWGDRRTPIVVTYTHGFNPLPNIVFTTALAIASRAVNTPVGGGVMTEKIGGYSVSYVSNGGAAVWATQSEMASIKDVLGIPGVWSQSIGPEADGNAGPLKYSDVATP